MNMVMMVQYFDALRDIGTTGQNNAVLIPYGAGGSNEILQQMTQAMVASDKIKGNSQGFYFLYSYEKDIFKNILRK